uniref:Uncharacterized protein n=1 Tax=Anguilla anguilla TaxID=7936 RepID=A0A0E9RYF5_ANGAN
MLYKNPTMHCSCQAFKSSDALFSLNSILFSAVRTHIFPTCCLEPLS